MAIRIDDVDLDRDRALVQRFQAGDGAAFDELYGRYRNRLERFCLKRVGDHHAAEEVAQEAFTRALAALPSFGGERRFYPWVSVIASRLCVDHHRIQARAELASEIECPGVPGGEEAIVDAVDAELVTTAMARLGPRHQDVLRLREVEGWSYRRIADHYGVPIGTIETLLFRARRALRREFDIIDGAGLVAIPFVGWLLRGLGRARDRVPPLTSINLTQSGLAVAATATAAAVAIAVVPGPGRPAPPVRQVQVATAPAQVVPNQAKSAPPGAHATQTSTSGAATPSVAEPTTVTEARNGELTGNSTIAPVTPPAAPAADPGPPIAVSTLPPVPPLDATVLTTAPTTNLALPLTGTNGLPLLPLGLPTLNGLLGPLGTTPQPGTLTQVIPVGGLGPLLGIKQ